MKKAKAIILAIVVVIVTGGLLYFASPAPATEKGIGILRPLYIVLSALAVIILLVAFIKYIKAIKRSVVDNLPLIAAVIAAGALIFILTYFSWPVEIAMKVELLWSVLAASLALVVFISVILVELIRGNGGLAEKLGISDIGIRKLKTFIYRSAAFGCLTVAAIVVYFIIDGINIFFIAWILFILQLGLLVFPLIFARIIVFR
ncbi:MAG: hypothetical protein WBB97_00050 [Dehalococcoidales bacterium]